LASGCAARYAPPFSSQRKNLLIRFGHYIAGPHVLMEEALFEGYVLPKGTVLLVPLWYENTLSETYLDIQCPSVPRGILHDESYFSDPMEFIPERWLDTEERGLHTAKLESVPASTSRIASLMTPLHSASLIWGWGKRCEPQYRGLAVLDSSNHVVHAPGKTSRIWSCG
jgi:hypothetical protein